MSANIERLISMLGKSKSCEWTEALNSVLTSPDVAEIEGYPRSDRVSFILDRAKMRQRNSSRLGLRTFGLDRLIEVLGTLEPERDLENFGLKNSSYTGSCFVLENKLIGCEFVARGLAKTVPFQG